MKISRKNKAMLTYVACLMLAFASPVAVYAEEPVLIEPVQSEQVQPADQPVAPETAVPTAPEPAAPKPPVNPVPAAPAAPKPPMPKETYTFNADTRKWSSNTWQWDPVANKYMAVKTVVNASDVPNGTSGALSGETFSTSTTNAGIANALDSIAVSGNANVKGNTKGGNAMSGNAASTATIINNVNSSMTNASNKEAATFVTDVIGDVNGDIMLQPMLLKAMLEANVANDTSQSLNSTNNTSIRNDLELTAASGNANVKGNTKAGNATSGSANTVADVVNIVNSMVAANQSFFGTVNIYGNLNGDILIAPDFIPQMLASNGGSTSNGQATKVSSRDTQEIVNNVSLAAESGQALIGGNTKAGNATSGGADTNLVIFNLSGHEIVASNSMLVFINVLGTWVGVIVDAPQGATAATVGNNVTKNNVEPNLTIDATNNTAITNNINLASKSGDATIANNTEAGDATTGKATASANIANISNSSLGLSGWFGVLFINVFGSWNGSFGIDTAAGNPIQQAAAQPSENTVLRFIPREQRTNRAAVQRLTIVDPAQDIPRAESPIVKQASTGIVEGASDTKSDIPTQQSYIDARKSLNIPLTAASLILVIGSGYVLRKYLF